MGWKEPGAELYDLLSEPAALISTGHYVVQSQTEYCDYDVWTRCYPWVCTCPDYTYNQHDIGHMCKHMFAVSMINPPKSNHMHDSEMPSISIVPEVDTHQCIHCGLFDTISHGMRHNKNYDVKRRLCKSCGKTYSVNIGFERLSHGPDTVVDVLNMYHNGESSRGVVATLIERDIKITHQTVLNRVCNMAEKAYKYASTLPISIGSSWRVDEMYTKIKGKQNYLYGIIDDKTRFWLAHIISPNKGTDDVRPLFANASVRAGSNPNMLISDGAKNFASARTKEYPGTIHISHIHIQNDLNNNKMEWFVGRIRAREKTMLSLKRPDSGILKGMCIHYNFVRGHMGIGNATPAYVAGIWVRGISKWRTLIQNGAKRVYSAMWPVHVT